MSEGMRVGGRPLVFYIGYNSANNTYTKEVVVKRRLLPNTPISWTPPPRIKPRKRLRYFSLLAAFFLFVFYSVLDVSHVAGAGSATAHALGFFALYIAMSAFPL